MHPPLPPFKTCKNRLRDFVHHHPKMLGAPKLDSGVKTRNRKPEIAMVTFDRNKHRLRYQKGTCNKGENCRFEHVKIPNYDANKDKPAAAKKKCKHCNKNGHEEATCWEKYPELKEKAKAKRKERVNIAKEKHAEFEDHGCEYSGCAYDHDEHKYEHAYLARDGSSNSSRSSASISSSSSSHDDAQEWTVDNGATTHIDVTHAGMSNVHADHSICD